MRKKIGKKYRRRGRRILIVDSFFPLLKLHRSEHEREKERNNPLKSSNGSCSHINQFTEERETILRCERALPRQKNRNCIDECGAAIDKKVVIKARARGDLAANL